uniref:Uncharacterized protein n=1 Tax=Oryza punctata TaxID=4537 RepID=A0A0E0MG44_ORYPU
MPPPSQRPSYLAATGARRQKPCGLPGRRRAGKMCRQRSFSSAWEAKRRTHGRRQQPEQLARRIRPRWRRIRPPGWWI